MPRKRDDDCLQELRWLYDRRDIGEARRDLARVCGRWAYFGLIRDLVVLKSLRLFGWQSGFQAQKCGHTN
jgi:hypothetical protein